MQFTKEHKERIADALKMAWQTKRRKAVIGERKTINGIEMERVKSDAGWLYWRRVPQPDKPIDLSTLTKAQRSRLRKKGFNIPFKKPGVQVGFKRPMSTRIKQSVSARKYLFDVLSIARDQKERIRKSLVYRAWRESVFLRDKYTCQECGSRNGNGKTVVLEAHHIKSYAKHPALRFNTSNGGTLCKPCHLKESKRQMRGNKNGRQKELRHITQMTLL